MLKVQVLLFINTKKQKPCPYVVENSLILYTKVNIVLVNSQGDQV